MRKLKRIIIAAVAQNGVIGKGNKTPWHSKEELRHFKNTTIGFPVIFGRKTFQSIGKPLIDRVNLIVSNNPEKLKKFKQLSSFKSLSSAYNYLRKNDYHTAFICGGEQVYRSSIKYAEEMLISHMNFESKGDKKFPKINMNLWKVKESKAYKEFTVIHYIRKNLSI